MIRTFIAIDLPTELLEALATTQTQVRDFLRREQLEPALRWSLTHNLHLTLRFLGDTSSAQRAQLATRLAEVAQRLAPFTLVVDTSGRALGGFPNLRQPRVLWTGVEGDLIALRRVQREMERAARDAGFAAELKQYSPHLTLSRAARDADRHTLAQVGQALDAYIRQAHTTMPAGNLMRFTVARLILYQSELGPGGSRYTPLTEVPLTGG